MAIAAVAVLITLLAAFELGLPRVLERYLAKRLTEGGGHARVHLKAFPAAKLLAKRGAELRVRASGLKATGGRSNGGSEGNAGFAHLDGFDRVDIQVVGVRLGPIEVSRLTLTREQRDTPYKVRAEGAVAGTPIPIDLRAEIESHDGRPRARSVSGSIAGLPGGAIVDFISAALASRL
jgi:hypothetical protein